MNIDIDTNLDGAKDLQDLAQRLTTLLNKLQQDLKNQPEFLMITADDQAVPENTPANTIIFRTDETAVIKTGYFDGKSIILPP